MSFAPSSEWSSHDMHSYQYGSSSTSPSTTASSTASSSSFAATTMASAPSHCSMRSETSAPYPRKQSVDRFYGHRVVSEMSEAVISALFACPLDSSSSTPASGPCDRPTPRLSEFIAYALHRTRLPEEVTFQALFLLRRLKSRFPAAKGSSGHRLFISALMLASKSSCDDTYSNKSWTIVSQGLFTLREVNQMERELFGYLGYKVNVEPEDLEAFTILLQNGEIAAVTDLFAAVQRETEDMPIECGAAEAIEADTSSIRSISTDSIPASSRYAYPSMARRASVSGHLDGLHAHETHQPAQPFYNTANSYHSQQAHPAATAAAARAAAAMAARHPPGVASAPARLSPNISAMSSSSRGSFSCASVYSATPSPSLVSRAGDSSNGSSGESPDTPASDFDNSPWTDNGKPAFVCSEPQVPCAQRYNFYEHFKTQQQFVPPQHYHPQQSLTANWTREPVQHGNVYY